MRIHPFVVSVVLACGAAGSVWGQQAPQAASHSPPAAASDQPTDPAADAAAAEEAAIRSSVQAYAQAFDAADAKAVASLWAADGEFVNDEGQTIHGRDAIEKEYAASFAAAPGVKIDLAIESMSKVAPGVAIVQGTSTFGPSPYGPPPKNRFTATYVKQEEKWLLASVHSTPVERSSNYERLEPLAQVLLGKWETQDEGGRVEMTCEWTMNENYLRRTYTVYVADEVASTGVQMIGWDPVAGQIASWLFDSDGGFERGVMKPDNGGWIVELTGVLRDGARSSSTNVIRPVDKNTFTWQSTKRSAGGQELPDTEVVQVVRAAASGDSTTAPSSP